MTVVKYSFTLVNNEGANPLDIVFGESQDTDVPIYADWDLSSGNIRLVKKQDALTQSALKMAFTEKQATGYGTHIYDFVGENDVALRKMSLFMDLSLGMMALKSFGDSEIIRQNLQPADLIATLSQLKVTEDEDDPTTSKITLAIRTDADEEINIGVL